MTGHLLYTDQDVELVRSIGSQSCGLSLHPDTARKILAALSSANRLVPPGSEVREERRKVVKVWYRSLQADGSVWCETSNQREVVELSKGITDRFERLVISQVEGPWTPWSPPVPDTKEGS